MRQVVDIARKLELTSIALGCLTRKELCAAFARANPDTVMTLQNSYNWQSGRSVPRNFSLFEDWAAALGMSEGPHFIMSSSLREFARALGGKVALPEELLESFGDSPAAVPSAAAVAPDPEGEPAAAWRNGALLQGSFLALSLAWSPAERGRLLAGALILKLESGGKVGASYLENVLSQPIAFEGSGVEDGRAGQVTLRCEANGATFLMAFHLPPLPGNLAGGVFAGNAIYDPNSVPTAGVILLLRNHELSQEQLAGATGYRDLTEPSFAEFLELLGYGRDPERSAEQEMLRLLTATDAAPLVSMNRDSLSRAAVLLDQRRLRATGQR